MFATEITTGRDWSPCISHVETPTLDFFWNLQVKSVYRVGAQLYYIIIIIIIIAIFFHEATRHVDKRAVSEKEPNPRPTNTREHRWR